MSGLSLLRSRFFWRLFAFQAALLVATAGIIGILVDRQMQFSLVERIESSLERECLLLSVGADERAFGAAPAPGLEAEVEGMGRRAGVRITFIGPQGEVVADSLEEASAMENHGRRPEVLDALAEGFGLARRHSKTLGDERLYVAHALRDEGGELTGTVRVSIPLENVARQRAALRGRVAAGALAGLLAALLLGLLAARRITVPIAEMTGVARALGEGRYDARVRELPANEIGTLGATLNLLGQEIGEQVAAATRDDARLRAMLAGMVEGVVAVDEVDRVVFCNRAALRLLGQVEGGPVGRPLWEWVRAAGLEDLLRRSRRQGGARGEIRVAPEAGVAVLEVGAHTLEAEGATGVVLVFADVTDLRRLETVRRDFVANVSHELKTPLTSIKGYVETLLDGALHDPENNERFLDKIRIHVDRLTHLVADLLSLARIEAQEQELERGALDWAPILEEVLRRHETAAREKGISLALGVAEGAGRVLGETESLTEIAENLIDNAIKYTPEGGRVRISLEREEEGVHLRVMDTGVGIPPEDQNRVFERFFRVDKARSRELGGTGLGLSIVKHFVGAMRGRIWVESQPGAGSCFHVRLPEAE